MMATRDDYRRWSDTALGRAYEAIPSDHAVTYALIALTQAVLALSAPEHEDEEGGE